MAEAARGVHGGGEAAREDGALTMPCNFPRAQSSTHALDEQRRSAQIAHAHCTSLQVWKLMQPLQTCQRPALQACRDRLHRPSRPASVQGSRSDFACLSKLSEELDAHAGRGSGVLWGLHYRYATVDLVPTFRPGIFYICGW